MAYFKWKRKGIFELLDRDCVSTTTADIVKGYINNIVNQNQQPKKTKGFDFVYVVIEVNDVPGGTSKQIINSFVSIERAQEWLEKNGYIKNPHLECWEHPLDDDFMCWTYIKIEKIQLTR